ncbi:MAG: plasmid pRiA4b ORF-3 family protein, partial [Anaerolineae bacterium]
MFWNTKQLAFTSAHARTLRGLAVDEDGPGTILRDFQSLLAFIRGRGLQVSKTYRLLPRKVLPELNAQMVRPLELGLKQPQLKSFPHIEGLYLLLRATGLSVISGTPSRPILAVDEALHESWCGLVSTERYFTLLETWLLRGRPEMLGEYRGFRAFERTFQDCLSLIRGTPPEGLPIAGNEQVEGYVMYAPGRTGIALLELFGFLSVDHGPPVRGQGWQIERVHRTPRGEAVFALLYHQVFGDIHKVRELEEASQAKLGLLQPVFRPYVPAWQRNFDLPAWTYREGTHVFKVSLWRDLWRRIAVPAGLTLDALAHAILVAYEFDHDHLYEFVYSDRYGLERRISHPFLEEKPRTDKVC